MIFLSWLICLGGDDYELTKMTRLSSFRRKFFSFALESAEKNRKFPFIMGENGLFLFCWQGAHMALSFILVYDWRQIASQWPKERSLFDKWEPILSLLCNRQFKDKGKRQPKPIFSFRTAFIHWWRKTESSKNQGSDPLRVVPLFDLSICLICELRTAPWGRIERMISHSIEIQI